MNNLPLLIRKITTRLDSNDLTNTVELHQLATAYTMSCTEFNAQAEKCQVLIQRGMIVEAGCFASSLNPSLEQQAELLNFADRDLFLELFALYEWPSPPLLRCDILSELAQHSADQKDLAPLLDAYRQIARSEDTQGKIYLLRKIVQIDRKPEWRETLQRLEEIYFNELAAQTKNAILAEDAIALQELLRRLTDSDWSIKINERVPDKAREVLEALHVRELARRAARCLDEINDAYSAFDYPALERGLRKWDALLEDRHQPDSAAATQVAEARGYYLDRKRQIDAERKHRQLLTALQSGLEQEIPLLTLEGYAKQIELLGKDIPEELKRQFFAYQEEIEDLRRRKKIVKIAVISAGSLGMLLLIALISYTLIMGAAEREWGGRLESSLKNNPSAVSQQLLDSLAQKSPSLRQRKSIQLLAQRIQVQKNGETTQQARLKEIFARIDADLPQYAVRRNALLAAKAEAARLVVDGNDRKRYMEMELAIKEEEARYIRSQDARYLEFQKKIRQLRAQFFSALEKDDFLEVERLIRQSDAMRDAMIQLEDVSSGARQNGKRIADGVLELRPKSDAARKQYDLRITLQDRLNAAASQEELSRTIDEYLRHFPGRPEADWWRTFRDMELALAGRHLAVKPEVADREAPFARDAAALAKFEQADRKLHEEARKELQAQVEKIKKAPVYAIVLKRSDGLLCDVYFSGRKVEWSKVNGENCEEFDAIATEEGDFLPVAYRFRDNTRYGSFRFLDGHSFFGNRIYPEDMAYYTKSHALAPHLRLICELHQALEQSPPEAAERTLGEFYQQMQKHMAINPVLKIDLAKRLLTLLQHYAPENYSELKEDWERVGKQVAADYRWRLAYRENSAEQQRLSTLLTTMKNIPLRQEKALTKQLLRVALARQVVPAGYLIAGKSGSRFVKFDAVPAQGELWSFDSARKRFVHVGTFDGAAIELAPAFNQIVGIQLLYAPTDGRSTTALRTEFRQAAARAGIADITWPESWPIFTGEEKQ